VLCTTLAVQKCVPSFPPLEVNSAPTTGTPSKAWLVLEIVSGWLGVGRPAA
jgi:hypothetical protein